jgi:hypothetical protein
MSRYLSGLCVAGLGLCGGGWLVVAAVAFGGKTAGLAGRVNLLTGAGLIAVCCLSLVCWSLAWRQRMRVDGVLADRFAAVSKRAARRNRRALGRDVRRAGKLAERSAREARRAARRSARAGSGGILGDGVLSAGAGLGSGSPADDPRNVAELIGQLREMLVPLLATTGSQGASGDAVGPAESALPRRTPSASAFRPATAPVPVRVPRALMPQSAVPAVDDGLGVPVDSEEAWW